MSGLVGPRHWSVCVKSAAKVGALHPRDVFGKHGWNHRESSAGGFRAGSAHYNSLV
jgi:hypothetical protein